MQTKLPFISMPIRTSRDGKVAIIHNGIIENASPATSRPADGGAIVSSPKPITEVAAKLLGKSATRSSRKPASLTCSKAIRRLARMLEGAFTILATDVRQPGHRGRRPSRFAAVVVVLAKGRLPRLRRCRVRGLHQACHGNRPGPSRDGVRRQGRRLRLHGQHRGTSEDLHRGLMRPPPKRAVGTPSWTRRSMRIRPPCSALCWGVSTRTAISTSMRCASTSMIS